MVDTPDAQSLDGLIERVKVATGPDRELDIAIGDALPPEKIFSSGHWFNRDDFVRYPAVTNSIDSAIALAGRLLPHHRFALFTDGQGRGPCCLVMIGDDPVVAQEFGATLPLAIILAFLTAMQEQSQ